MTTDKVLWQRFKEGSEAALSEIYHREVDHLYAYGLKFTGDKQMVLDAVQDLFVDLMRSRHKLGVTDNIRFYLLRALRRRLASEVKRGGRYTSLEKLQEFSVRPVEGGLIHEEGEQEKRNLLSQGLASLSQAQREALHYRYFSELSYDEIAQIMEMKQATVRQLVSRGIQALKRFWNRLE